MKQIGLLLLLLLVTLNSTASKAEDYKSSPDPTGCTQAQSLNLCTTIRKIHHLLHLDPPVTPENGTLARHLQGAGSRE